MDTLLKIVDTSINFWIANPNFKSVDIFKKYYDKDKSKDKDYSSRVMWAIAMLVDLNVQNVWRNKPEQEKAPILKKDVIQDDKFEWSDVENLKQEYISRCTSIPMQELRNFLNKIHDRQKFIDDTNFTLDSYDEKGKIIKGTAAQLDAMMVNTTKIWSQYSELLSNFSEDQEEGNIRGGRTESASEAGLI